MIVLQQRLQRARLYGSSSGTVGAACAWWLRAACPCFFGPSTASIPALTACWPSAYISSPFPSFRLLRVCITPGYAFEPKQATSIWLIAPALADPRRNACMKRFYCSYSSSHCVVASPLYLLTCTGHSLLRRMSLPFAAHMKHHMYPAV